MNSQQIKIVLKDISDDKDVPYIEEEKLQSFSEFCDDKSIPLNKMVTAEVIRYYKTRYVDKYGFKGAYFICADDQKIIDFLCNITKFRFNQEVEEKFNRMKENFFFITKPDIEFETKNKIKLLPWYKRLFNRF